ERRAAPVLLDLPIAPVASAASGEATPAIAPLFTEREQESPWGPRLAVMTAAALIIASIVLFSLAAHGPKAPRGVASTSATVSGGPPARATSAGRPHMVLLRP